MRGLEPPRGLPHTDLNRARLPIPPHPRGRQCSPPVLIAVPFPTLRRGLLICGVLGLAFAAPAHARSVEVVVTLKQPPLAAAFARERTLAYSSFAGRTGSCSERRRAEATSTGSTRAQREVRNADPGRDSLGSRSAGRYGVVLNGFAVVVPRVPPPRPLADRRRRARLADRALHATARPDAAADRRADALGAGARHRGPGDEDRDHRRRRRPDASLLQPRGLLVSARLPEGADGVHDAEGHRRPRVRSGYTTLRACAPAVRPRASPSTARTSPASRPATTTPSPTRVSGSPASHRVRTSATTRRSAVPTPGFGLNGNVPELAAAVEAAVRDGMDVINLSLGEPEVDPARDILARALDAAAAAGVIVGGCGRQ